MCPKLIAKQRRSAFSRASENNYFSRKTAKIEGNSVVRSVGMKNKVICTEFAVCCGSSTNNNS